MASVSFFTRKDGTKYCKIRVRNGREGQTYCKNVDLPENWDGWGQKAKDKHISKISTDFENEVKAGIVQTRKERLKAIEQKAAEEAKIKTLRQYGEKVFMPTVAITNSEHTRASYQSNLKNHIYPTLGEIRLPEITTTQINALLLEKQSSGLSQSSCDKIYRVLKVMFKMASEEEAIEKNPMDRAKKPKVRKGEEAKQGKDAFTESEVKYIFECLEKENAPLKWKVLMRLLFDTGIREGEALGIKWEDIDTKNKEVTIKRSLCYTPQKGIYVNAPKNGKSRKQALSPQLLVLLAQFKKEHHKANRILALHSPASDFVFTQEGTNTPMHPQTPYKYFKRFGKRHGIEKIYPHKFRHTFGTLAARNGINAADLAKAMGHSNSRVSYEWYVAPNEDSALKASEAVWHAIGE